MLAPIQVIGDVSRVMINESNADLDFHTDQSLLGSNTLVIYNFNKPVITSWDTILGDQWCIHSTWFLEHWLMIVPTLVQHSFWLCTRQYTTPNLNTTC
jgi:hypothetical protein